MTLMVMASMTMKSSIVAMMISLMNYLKKIKN